MFKEIENVKTIDELKKVGSIDSIINIIEDVIKPIKIRAKSYEELFEYTQFLQQKYKEASEEIFFKNERDKYLFCLTQVDGEKRNKVIGLTDELYDNKDLAVSWHRKIVKVLRQDINDDELTKEAFNELEKLYRNIMECFEEDN
ncbi:hypothetical protein [Clostridium butyricum]|uniref:hypothetical protein n=1 Tax=Clostridium butyricum TaxID=1492 RepID=UPI00374E5DB8